MKEVFSQFSNSNGVFGNSQDNWELGNTIEDLGNEHENFKFDENQTNYMEDVLDSEGIANIKDIESSNLKELIDAIDMRVKSLKPQLSTKVHMDHFGRDSDVWKEFRSYLEPKYLEAPSDKVQQEQIASSMCEIDGIQYENWVNQTMEGKVALLNELEQKIAMIAHRPAANIRSEQMEADLFGYQLNGDIAINESMLEVSGADPAILDKMLETLIHEGRHAYQHYNVEERMVHQSEAQVESWRENFEQIGYADGEPIRIPIIGNFTYTNEGLAQIGARLYYYQPVEIDARVFAADTMSTYHKHLNA